MAWEHGQSHARRPAVQNGTLEMQSWDLVVGRDLTGRRLADLAVRGSGILIRTRRPASHNISAREELEDSQTMKWRFPGKVTGERLSRGTREEGGCRLS